MPATDLSLLIDAALAAGEIACAHWRDGPEVWTKSDDSPVSAADLAVDAALRKTLTAARPGYGWLSEETADSPERLAAEHCFIVDPIDGTRAFLDGKENWALSLAVVEGGQVTAGVVHMPAKGRTYTAARGQGAQLNGQAIAASQAADPDGATALGARWNYAPEHWAGGAPPRLDRHFRPSLAYRMALVAEGRFDAMLSLRPVWEWDIAAGSLIAAEAGAAVTTPTGAPPRFNGPSRQLAGLVAAPPALHAALLAALAAPGQENRAATPGRQQRPA